MNNRKPPALATWMLDHLGSRGSNEALSGDLLEAFRTGRSAGWYWYQVIAAIAAPSALQLGQPRWRYLAYSLAMVVYLRNCIWCGDCHALHLARSCCLFDFPSSCTRQSFPPIGPEGVLVGFSGIRAGPSMQDRDRYPLSAACQSCRALGKSHGAWCD
jgi:hypothetical protein